MRRSEVGRVLLFRLTIDPSALRSGKTGGTDTKPLRRPAGSEPPERAQPLRLNSFANRSLNNRLTWKIEPCGFRTTATIWTPRGTISIALGVEALAAGPEAQIGCMMPFAAACLEHDCDLHNCEVSGASQIHHVGLSSPPRVKAMLGRAPSVLGLSEKNASSSCGAQPLQCCIQVVCI